MKKLFLLLFLVLSMFSCTNHKSESWLMISAYKRGYSIAMIRSYTFGYVDKKQEENYVSDMSTYLNIDSLMFKDLYQNSGFDSVKYVFCMDDDNSSDKMSFLLSKYFKY